MQEPIEYRGERLVPGRRPGPEWQVSARGWTRFYDDGTAAAWAIPHGEARWQLAIVKNRDRPSPADEHKPPEPRSIEELCRVRRTDWTDAEAERMRTALTLGLVREVPPKPASEAAKAALRGYDIDAEDRARLKALEAFARRYDPSQHVDAYAGDLSGPEWSDTERKRLASDGPELVARVGR